MKYYDEELLYIFSNIKNVFNGESYNIIGTAGDFKVGEYVQLYLQVDIDMNDKLNSRINNAKFSAFGSTMLIVISEQLCRLINDVTLKNALTICEPSHKDGIYNLNIVSSKEHSFNFVLQAFYNAMQNISNYGCETS